MKNQIIGSVLAGIAMFFWGFLFWGLNTLPYKSLKSVKDHEGSAAFLNINLPGSGSYFVPSMSEKKELEQRFKEGPTAMIHIYSGSGESMYPMVMIVGFFHVLAGAFFLSYLLKLASPALPDYMDRVRLVSVAGLCAGFLVDFSDSIWWRAAWEWKVWSALYTFTLWTVCGLVLAKFVKAEK